MTDGVFKGELETEQDFSTLLPSTRHYDSTHRATLDTAERFHMMTNESDNNGHSESLHKNTEIGTNKNTVKFKQDCSIENNEESQQPKITLSFPKEQYWLEHDKKLNSKSAFEKAKQVAIESANETSKRRLEKF